MAAISATDERPIVKIALLKRFVVVAEELHFPRAAVALGIPLPSVYSTIEKLEAELGYPLFTKNGETRLTREGNRFLVVAHQMIAEAPEQPAPVVKAGGKAKASKGRGRAPSVKGQPKPFKKRQGR